MPYRLMVVRLSIILFVIGPTIRSTAARTVISPSLTLAGPGVVDQDDMAFWVHPTDLAKSTVITSDKSANKLFVYDLNGNTLQQIPAQEPGNVDTRYGFPLGTDRVDIVAFNERGTNKIRVYRVDPITRLLEQIDDGNIDSGPNYGIALYRSRRTGKFYVYTGPKVTTPIVQFELVDNGNGTVSGRGPLRTLDPLTQAQGMVADDETGVLYVSEEAGGVWAFDAEPRGDTSGTKIASVGDNGLKADVEGITIYYTARGQGYLIASSQGSSTFNVYQRKAPHAFVGTFKINGVGDSDGVDVINLPLNNTFAQGIFAVHNGRRSDMNGHAVEIVKWQDIAVELDLTIDTQYWDPRIGAARGTAPVASPGAAPDR
jgi:3-phytase